MSERRWFGHATRGEQPPFAGGDEPRVLRSGVAALVELEREVSDAICRDEALPAPTGATSELRCADAAAAATTAGGLASTGQRVACFLECSGGSPLVARIKTLVARRVPLVAYAVIDGSEHVEQLTASGALVAVARDAAHALDLALVARRASESALTPAVVALEAAEIALAFSDVAPPSDELIREYLGRAADTLESPTPAQRMLFGERRRRVPRWFDLERPAAHGLELPRPEREAATLGRRVFFDAALPEAVAQAAARFRELTGRDTGRVTLYSPRRADQLVVAQGAAVPLIEQVAERLHKQGRTRLRVLGLTWRCPSPGSTLREAADGMRRVTTLDRTPTGAGNRPPLCREVGSRVAQDDSSIRSVTYDRLSAADLAAELAGDRSGDAAIGVTSPVGSSRFPRRDVMLGQVRRDYPSLVQLTRSGEESAFVDLRPAQAFSLALYLRADAWPEDSLHALIDRLREPCGRFVRSRVQRIEGSLWRLDATFAREPSSDPGAGVPLDMLLIADQDRAAEWDAFRELVPDGTTVIATRLDAAALAAALPADWIETARQNRLKIYRVAGDVTAGERIAALAEAAVAIKGDRVDALECVVLDGIEIAPPQPLDAELPLAVRRFGEAGETFDNVARFWGEFDQPRRHGFERATADPYLALGGVPPCTATFADNTARRETVPVIDPARCDGCGTCWIDCPDSAIGVTALGSVALLDAAAPQAAGQGAEVVDKLRRAHKQVGARIDRLLSQSPQTALDVAQVREAFEWAFDKLGLTESELDGAHRYVDTMADALSRMPLSVTETFFRTPHKADKGSGELLLLAINPQSCQGCGICARVCPQDAVLLEPQDDASLERMGRRWRVWEALPDTRGATIAQAEQRDEPGPLPAVLMSRHTLFSVTGGAESEPGSGARIAVRQIAAVVEYVMQRRLVGHARELAQIADRLRQAIREELAAGMQVEDLGHLSEALAAAGSTGDLRRVASRLGELGETTDVNADRVQRLAALAGDVERAHAGLTSSAAGTGRARFGVVVAGGAAVEWAARFPRNPFAVPVSAELDGGAADAAVGLARGVLDQCWSGARLLRTARAALDDPQGLAKLEAQLADRGWTALSDEESLLGSPVLLLVGSDALHGHLADSVMRLLSSELPVKVVLLDEADLYARYADPLLRALAQRNAFVLSSSIAHPGHLFSGMRAALEYRGPALIRLHAPSPVRHGFARDAALERARQAVECRVTPLLRYDPTSAGPFGLRLSLEGNPQPQDDWATDAEGKPLTPAVWAAGEQRYQDPNLLVAARGSTRPTVPGPNGENLAHGESLERAVEARAAVWRMLQELAGIVNPFVEPLRRELRDELEREREATASELQRQFDARVEAHEGQQTARHVERLRQRLMQLAGYGPGRPS